MTISKMLSLLKRIYAGPFVKEQRSVRNVVVYRTVVAVIELFYAIKYRRTLRRTRKFLRDKKAEVKREGRSAFVFANGPSLGDIDLNKVEVLCKEKGHDLICINSYLSKSSDMLKPTFAVFADNVHFNGGGTQYTKDVETCEAFGIPYFAPAKYVDDSNPLMFGYCGICNIDARNTSDITKAAGYYGVTAFFAISLAKMLGYSNIYICGFDNSYFKDFKVTSEGKMVINHKHYYDSKGTNTQVPCLYEKTSNFFFDSYRHFDFLEKISKNDLRIKNVAKVSYLSTVSRDFDLDIYRN